MKPESLRRRSCLLLVSVVVLQAAFLVGLPASSGSDPDVVDNLDGTKTATWDLDDPLNYSHSGVSVSGGVAELERVNEGFVDTTEADFLSAVVEDNVSVLWPGDVELSGNAGNLISVGDFSTPGPWSYESSSAGDITTDRDTVEDIFARHKPDAVAHLGAMGSVRYSVKHPHLYIDVNIVGTVNVLDAAQRHGAG
ncbi:MAG: GDP-mannose 4,6-dehydratase, partial [Candidatus Thermoplasmatota archaeon]|nr:GDP-mannose 4,6-dehydratase [Candidatus Thermoplasmatota archaeon]